MNGDFACIGGKLNFVHILKLELEKSDFQFLIKNEKERVKQIPKFPVGMYLN